MVEQKDWKSHYDELLQQHEAQTAADAELAQLLARTIIRLTLAASGLDAKLDPHLKSIRDAVRSGVSHALKQKLDGLSDSLIHFSDEDVANAVNTETEGLCTRVLDRFQIQKRDMPEATRILRELLAQPEQVTSEDLSRLITSLNAAGGVVSVNKRTGLFERLLGSRSVATEPEATPPNQILLNLLEQASWPGHWGTEVGQLKRRLTDQSTADEWVTVLQDLLELSARSFGDAKKEIREAEDFLEELTQRLQDLEEHLRKAHTGRSELFDHSRRLNAEVSAQVGGLESSLETAADLQQLKRAVSLRLQAIQQSMDVFLDEEQQWFTQAESSEQELRERLSTLEKESNELRHRMLEAHHLALLDAVTDLPNRMAYEERVEQEYARWKRFAEPLTMLVWDVDNFKAINDRYGHQAGDKALRVIAQSLKQRLRETDFIARYGGEEFVTLLCGADEEQAYKVAEKMRMGVMECAFHSAGKAVNVTISCGLSQFAEGDSSEAVFARADQAVYQAKRNGKNRCEIA